MNAVILNMLKSLPMPMLIDVFLALAEEFSKKSDNKIDDQVVAVLRAAFKPTQP